MTLSALFRMTKNLLLLALFAAVVCGPAGVYAQSIKDDLPWGDDYELLGSYTTPQDSSDEKEADTQDEQAKSDENPFMPLEALVGRWSSGEGEKAFTMAILPQQGLFGGKKKLEAHTDRRIWKGHFDDNDDDALVAEFFYSPRADEMDESIPAWARQKFDGDVEWQIKLFARGPEHHPHLEMEWHRQQIKWDPSKKSAELIEDEGEPLKFTLSYAPLLQLTQPAPLSIGIYPVRSGDEKYKSAGQLSGILQQQHFMVELSAPFHALEKLGRSIEAEFKGTTSGKSASITLEARVPPGDIGSRVVYTSVNPIRLGDCTGEALHTPPTLSIAWFYSLKAEGTCIPFAGADGEILTVGSGKSVEYRFQWWKDWMSAALASHRDEIERRRIVYNAILTDAGADTAQKNAARQKITMIRNYDALMRSERLIKQHKISIGEMYLGGNGLGSYATYAGITDGYLVPGKGLLSFTDDDFSGITENARTIRWPTFEEGPYVPALSVFANSISWLFGYAPDGNILGRNALSILPEEQGRAEGANVDQALKRDIVWANPVERLGVALAIQSISSGRINEISESFFKQGVLMMYDGVAEESGAAFAFIFADWLLENAPAIMHGIEEIKWPALAGPRNHRGESIDGWGIAKSALEFSLNFAGEVLQVTKHFSVKNFWIADTLKSTPDYNFPWRTKVGTPAKAEQLYTVSRKSSAAENIISKGDNLADELPKSIAPDAQKMLASSYKPAPLYIDEAVDVPLAPPSRITPSDKVEVAIPMAAAQEARIAFKPVLPELASLQGDYGSSARLVGDMGSLSLVQQAKHSDGMIAANYIIARQTGLRRDEATGAYLIQSVLQQAAADGKIDPVYIFYLGHGAPYPDAVINHYLAGHGIQVVERAGSNAGAKLIDAHIATEGGWMVTARLSKNNKPRSVVIDKITLDAQGAPQKVQFFDPVFGTTVEVDAAAFDRLLDRAGKKSVFKATRVKQPDVSAPSSNSADIADEVAVVPPPVADITPALPGKSSIVDVPTEGKIYRYFDKNNPDVEILVPLGELLGRGSFSQVYRHADDPNIVVRINNRPGSLVGNQEITQFDIFAAQKLDDLGRKGLESAWPLSKNFDMLPVYSSTTLPDGRRIELVAIARGEPAKSVLKKRARETLNSDEMRTLENYESFTKNDRMPPQDLVAEANPIMKKLTIIEKFSPEEARAIAQTLHDLNQKGYVALDMHNANFNLLRVDGKVKVEVLDPGGIVPTKGLDPAAARRAQEEILYRPEAYIAEYKRLPERYDWYDDRIQIMEKISDDLDLDQIGLDPEDIPFKPAMGIINPEIGEAFRAIQ